MKMSRKIKVTFETDFALAINTFVILWDFDRSQVGAGDDCYFDGDEIVESIWGFVCNLIANYNWGVENGRENLISEGDKVTDLRNITILKKLSDLVKEIYPESRK